MRCNTIDESRYRAQHTRTIARLSSVEKRCWFFMPAFTGST